MTHIVTKCTVITLAGMSKRVW